MANPNDRCTYREVAMQNLETVLTVDFYATLKAPWEVVWSTVHAHAVVAILTLCKNAYRENLINLFFVLRGEIAPIKISHAHKSSASAILTLLFPIARPLDKTNFSPSRLVPPMSSITICKRKSIGSLFSLLLHVEGERQRTLRAAVTSDIS